MPETQCAHQEAGDDLVANAQQCDTVIHCVAQGDHGRQRDRVAAEKRQFHAVLALRNTIAHGWCSTGDLHRGANFARPDLHALGITIIRLMRRKHVVVGGDYAEVRSARGHDCLLVVLCARIGMCQIRA